jgi:hypothetical protein
MGEEPIAHDQAERQDRPVNFARSAGEVYENWRLREEGVFGSRRQMAVTLRQIALPLRQLAATLRRLAGPRRQTTVPVLRIIEHAVS